MGDHSQIEWTEATWNPLAGCSPVSEECRNCYAAKEALRLGANPNAKIAAKYEGTSEIRGTGDKRRPVFTGRVNLVPDALDQPLRWKRPRRIFVNSMSDLFHEAVPFEFVDRVFAVMALAHWHTFQVLTKRPERMAEYFAVGEEALLDRWEDPAVEITESPCAAGFIEDVDWPLPNVWLGTSVGTQAAADERIPHLLRCPAAVRFLSCEPLLGPVDLGSWLGRKTILPPAWTGDGPSRSGDRQIGWVIAGGESGPGARPMHPDWARSLRDQCQAAGVPFFFKQTGEYEAHCMTFATEPTGEPTRFHVFPDGLAMYRVGKKAAGRLLDGQEWNQFPEVARG